MRNSMMRLAVLGVFLLAFVAAGAAAQEKPASVAGKWEMSFEGPQGPMTRPFTLEQDGEKLKGSMEGRQGATITFEGTVKGKKIEFTIERQGRDGQTIKTKYSGAVEGDSIKGTIESPQGARDWTAKKVK